MRQPLVVVLLALLAAACGPAGSPPVTGQPEPRADHRLLGIGLVLDDGDGAELCLGGVAESLPPQCGGPTMVGWDWSTIEDRTRRSGTVWTDGEYAVIGTFDPDTARFTLSEPPVRSEEYDGPRPGRFGDATLTTPCPEPDGGWEPVDPELTTERALDEAARVADRLDGFADLWWDQSINPASDDPDGVVAEDAMNDPALLVLNVRVRGDVAAAEARLREVWGGSLCVTEALRTEAELRRIVDQVSGTPGMLFLSSGRDVVDMTVTYDDGTLQQRFDERYGAGVVRVESALVPLSRLER